jgi:hypothetical protein
MASILKVDTIQDQSGNNIINENADTITIGKSGDTVNLASGATAGFGKVLQVVTATDSTQRSTTSTSFVTASNTLSVSITPSSASNKVLILVSSTIAGVNNDGVFTIFRDSTNLSSNGFIAHYNGGVGAYGSMGINVLDSPSSTSAITYQVYFKNNGGGNTSYLNYTSQKGSITAMEIAG